MTAGTGLIMWFGELVTDKGIGNGMSLLIFTSIAAGFPASLWAIQQNDGAGTSSSASSCWASSSSPLVVFVEQSQRRIPVQYAKRHGRPPDVRRHARPTSRSRSTWPASSRSSSPARCSSLPALVAQFNQPPDGDHRRAGSTWVQDNLARGDHPIYMLLYVALILFFTFFYVSITFNPTEVADNMKKYGGFIPGIRAGRPTAEYLDYVLTRITVPGALYLAVVSLIPLIALVAVGANQNFPFGGTSILIIVGVGLETVKQIEAQLQQRHYEGFLR